MSKSKRPDKQAERDLHAKAMEDFLKRGGKIEQIEIGKSGQTFKGPLKKTATTTANKP